MILVVGATGMMGAEVCARLAGQHQPVRALVRASPDLGRLTRLHALGVDTVSGDLRDRASLDVACRDVTAVVATASSMPFSYEPGSNTVVTVDRDGMFNLIAAAQAAGVRYFVHTSFTGAIDADFPLRNAKREAEQRLRESGLSYTILRPNCFMEVWLSPAVGFDPANARAIIYGEGRNPLAWIAVRDVAEYAIASLTHPAARNTTLELGGPEALSPLQVVAIFERVSGRTFTVEHVSEEALAAQQAAATDPMQQSFVALMRAYAHGAIGDTTAQRTFGLRQTTVEDYARRVVHSEGAMADAKP